MTGSTSIAVKRSSGAGRSPPEAGSARRMKVQLDYGEDGLTVEVPDENLDALLRLNPARPIIDAAATVQDLLANPIGSPPLAQRCRGRRSACVVISDIT